MNTIKDTIQFAMNARKKAYTPYSHFKVGACLVAKNGQIFTGCNIENAGYSSTNCAERTAFFKAISEGVQEFDSITIIGGSEKKGIQDFCPPCGVCLQVMMEFCDYETFPIILGTSPKDYKIMTLKEILPLGFGPKNLNIEL